MAENKEGRKDWSCGMETEEYEEDIELLKKDAISAIEETGKGFFVNLVTPANHGNPDEYLVPILKKHFGDSIDTKFVDQCGCGGYVLKVKRK